MDVTWFFALAVFGYLTYVLFQRHAVQVAGAEIPVEVKVGKKKKRSTSAKTGTAAAETAAPPVAKQEGGGKEEKGKKKGGKKNVLVINDPKKGLREAVETGPTVDDEGFTTVVTAKSKDNKRRISEMSPEARATYLKRKEAAEDAKWQVVGQSVSNGPNSYSTLDAKHRPKTTGKALPAKKTERQVNKSGVVPLEPTKEMLERMAAAQRCQDDLPPVDLDFRINAQGKWYPITELLATNDFDHAPQLVKVYISTPDSCVGSVFCKIRGKVWAGEHTADEPWLMAGFVTPLHKLITNEATEVEATIAWQDGAAVKLTLPAGSDSLNLEHVRAPSKHPSGVFKVSFKDFVQQYRTALEGFQTFAEKMEDGCEVQAAKAAALEDANPTKAARMLEGLEKVRNKLPSSDKISKHLAMLDDAITQRWPDL